ncbi:hypothetical protein HPB49_005681 [Dermacentor silvarum]|uniref:Uncharacterized protein n=1 Tax=Dermacentor silvarum TaxID=543639 RepID=A0ACB8C7I2_DERSI|nr:hypothetical protein HPB49_005681 [Dermacentor silvarum]
MDPFGRKMSNSAREGSTAASGRGNRSSVAPPDFRDPLQELGVLKDVTGIGPFQMTHVWLIKLRTPEAKEVLVNAGGLEVKGRFCVVIDPVQQDITLKVHWVPFHVTGEALKRIFDHYGEVKEVRQENWKVRGFEQTESTTRIVRMTLREDLTPDALPHSFKIFGGSVLVVVPGRARVEAPAIASSIGGYAPAISASTGTDAKDGGIPSSEK